MPLINRLVLPIAALMLSACGNLPEPEAGRTMRDIYDEQMAGGSDRRVNAPAGQSAARPAHDAVPPRYSRYTRNVQTEVDNLFPVLPNPTLFLYIRPHTVGADQIPVPGYTVPIKMYERDQHAMPGEVVPAETSEWEVIDE